MVLLTNLDIELKQFDFCIIQEAFEPRIFFYPKGQWEEHKRNNINLNVQFPNRGFIDKWPTIKEDLEWTLEYMIKSYIMNPIYQII